VSQQNPASPELMALAHFAEAIADPDPARRRAFANDPLGELDNALAPHGLSRSDLPDEVQDFINSLSYEELRLLGRLQNTMVDLRNQGRNLDLSEQVNPSIAKL
jgi:hypothetical protein